MKNEYKPSPIRLNYIPGARKSIWRWLWQSMRSLWPCRCYNEDDGQHWGWYPRWAHRHEFVPGPYIMPGEAGYDTAEYEIGFIQTPASFERQAPHAFDERRIK